MWEGVGATVIGKIIGGATQFFSRNAERERKQLEQTQLKANTAKLTAEANHLEKTKDLHEREIELGEKHYAHNRLAWMVDPYRELKARKLDAFAEATTTLWVLPNIMVAAKTPVTPEITTQLNTWFMASLEKFSAALPYMTDEMRFKYGDFVGKIALVVAWLQNSQRTGTGESLQTAASESFDQLLGEIRAWVEPIELYCRLRDGTKTTAEQDKPVPPDATVPGKPL